MKKEKDTQLKNVLFCDLVCLKLNDDWLLKKIATMSECKTYMINETEREKSR